MGILKKYLRFLSPLVVVIIICFLGGCADTLSEVTEVDKFRVLGVSVDPPEIRPEQTDPLEISVLWHDPHGEGREVEFAWVFCLGAIPTATGFEYCEPLDEDFPPVISTADQGGDSFTLPVPPQELFDLIPEGEVFPVTAIILMCAGGELPAADTLLDVETYDLNSLCDGGEGLSAYKTIDFTSGSLFDDDVNVNPAIDSLTLDGTDATPTDPNSSDEPTPNVVNCPSDGCDQDLEIIGTFSDDSYQEYTIEDVDGVQTQTEHPYISWYATGGIFSMQYSISDSPEDLPTVSWNPKEPGEYFLWAVANDHRGGISWREYHIAVE